MASTTNDTEAQALSLWWLLLVFGILTMALGVFFVASPHETLRVFTVIAGVFLLLDGVLAIFSAVVRGGDNRGLLAIVGVLSAIAGLILIKKPFETLVVFTLIIGVWFVVAGVVRLMSAFSSHDGRGAQILAAAIDLIAGIVILSWPELGLATFAVIIGIVLILRGALFTYAGFVLRKIDRASGGPATPLAG